MNTFQISDEAVEAASKVLKYEDENPGRNYPQIARLALEAAAPHMLEDSWGQGYGAGWNDCLLDLQNGGAKMTPSPYRRQA